MAETNNFNINYIDFVDSLKFYTSDKFIEKHHMKYSSILMEQFQQQIVGAFKKQRPIKVDKLQNRLVQKTGLSEDIVSTFLLETDAVEELYPLILR